MLSHLIYPLPEFLLYLAVGLGLATLFGAVYIQVTPHKEWTLIREGNLSAAIAFSGSLLGFVLPLASVITNSTSILDFALWGFVALVIQILAFFFAQLIIRDLPRQIEKDNRAVALLVGAIFIAVGMLNSACMTW
jgi:putative membrane protein